MIKKGEYVEVELCVLTKEQRAPQVPLDTKEVPLMMKTKGYLLEDAKLNDEVEIKTAVNRIVKGALINSSPSYNHNFGDFVDEVQKIRIIIEKETRDSDE